MKKLSKPLSARFDEVTLFFEDVESIVKLLRELGDVQFRTDEFAFESLQELAEYPAPFVTSLYFHCREPFAYVDIDAKSVRLFVGSEKPEHRRVFERLQEIIARSEVVRDRILESPTIIGALSGAALSALFGIYFIEGMAMPEKNAFAAGVCLLVAALLAWDRFTLRRKRVRTSKVWLSRSTEAGTFWNRHGERVLVAIVASLVTVAVMILFRIAY